MWGCLTFMRFSDQTYLYAQHEVLAAVASGRNVILCKSSDRPLRKEFSMVPSRRTHEHRAGLPSDSRLQTANGAREA